MANINVTYDPATRRMESGEPVLANVAAITTADGSDAGTTQTLANANKAKINALLAALKTAGIMVADA